MSNRHPKYEVKLKMEGTTEIISLNMPAMSLHIPFVVQAHDNTIYRGTVLMTTGNKCLVEWDVQDFPQDERLREDIEDIVVFRCLSRLVVVDLTKTEREMPNFVH